MERSWSWVARFGPLVLVLGIAAGCGEGGSRLQFLQNPILGGQEVPPGGYMEVVLLTINSGGYQYSCTGTLISRRVVLTAAHCVDFDDLTPQKLSVRFGKSQAESVRVPVAEFAIHPDWDSNRLRNDLALIRLDDDPPAGVSPVPHLPASLEITDLDVGNELTFVGFGTNDLGLLFTKVWMTADLWTVCTRQYGCQFAQRNTICISQEPTGICSGDSGGPIFIERSGQRYVAGVNSYTGVDPETGQECVLFGCGTKVDAFQAFIDDFVGDPDASPCQLDADCASGHCSDGVCCAQDCDGRCQACDSAGQVGTCVSLPDGSPCPDPNLCNGDEVCTAGRCEAGEPLVCSDGVECTRDLCDPSDGCTFRPDAPSCFDDNECTRDLCDAVQGCLFEDLPDRSPCGLRGKCQAGVCVEKSGGSGCGCGAAGVPAGSGLLGLIGLLALALRRGRSGRAF